MSGVLAALAFAVAVMYLTIAVWVVPRLTRTLGAITRVAILAKYGAVLFFLGCAATHVHIAVHAFDETSAFITDSSSSLVVGHIVPHLAQVVGGLTFIVICQRRLDIRVATKDETRRIRDLENRLDHALNAGGMGAWNLNLVTGAAWHSPHHDRVFGYDSPVDRWDQEVFLDHIVAEDREFVEEQFRRAASAGGMSFECRVLWPNGTERWIAVEGTVATDHDDSPVLTGTVADVTERRHRQEERNFMEQQLHQVRRMEAVGRLAAGVAHDFNNLLTVINGWTELALKRDTGAVRDELTAIAAAGDRGRQLTDQLLSMNRHVASDAEPAHVNALVVESIRMLSRLIDRKIRIEHHLDDRVGLAQIDPGHLSQVLLNLALNARDAMPDGGVLTLTTSLTEPDDSGAGDRIVLTVGDDGQGMTEETVARIFEPFFTTKDVGDGTGLGLATAFVLVTSAGGEITVDSELGRGSVFTITLPVGVAVRSGDLAGQPTAPSLATPALSGHERILLVEDDDAVREFASAALAGAGYHVVDVDGPLDALDVDATDFDLLVTDISMPGMNGHQLAELLTSRHPELRVLLISALPNATSATASTHRFLKKPFTPHDLLAAARGALDVPLG